MKKIDYEVLNKVLLVLLKIVLAVPALILFILIRCMQYFLKICGGVVSFVCMVASVVFSLGILVELFYQIQGNGPGVGAILLSVCVAGALAYVPIAGVNMAMLVLEAVCSWIWKFYMGSSENWKVFYKRPDYKWSTFDGENGGKDTDPSEIHIHYFKGVKNLEELKKRQHALFRIYRPDNAFEEDEITKSIVEEYEYLRDRFLDSKRER